MPYSPDPRLRLLTLAALCLLVTPWCAAAPEASGNLLQDGAFGPVDTKGGPANWSIHDWGKQPTFVSAKVVKGGFVSQHCLELQGLTHPLTFGAFSHPIALGDNPPPELLLTFFYRTADQPQADVSCSSYAEDFTINEWNTPLLSGETVPLENSGGWHLFSWRVRVQPATRQVVPMIRIRGAGTIYVDGVSVRALPGEAACEVLSGGLVMDARGQRQCRLQLTNRTAAALPLRVELKATGVKGQAGSATAKVDLPPGKPQPLELTYSFPTDVAYTLAVSLIGPQPDVIYDQQTLVVPGLLDGELIRPAFRNTLYASLNLSDVLVRGRVNAPKELYSKLKLQARLVGLGEFSPDFSPDDDGNWQCSLPATGLLTGGYTVRIIAKDGDKTIGKLELPLAKADRKDLETVYDDRERLITNGQPRLPIGLFYALDENDQAAAAEAGFNTLVVPSRLAYTSAMAAMGKLGLSVLIDSATQESDFWQNIAAKYANSPALAGWYVLPRPASQSPPVAPALVADLYARLSAIDAHHPFCLALDSISRLEPYAPWADIIMPWTAPEPAGDLRSVDAMVQRAVRVAAGRKPVWPVIQMTGDAWTVNARLNTTGQGRPPTPAEYRCMIYLALARGANGVFSYAYRIPHEAGQQEYFVQRDAPELWQMARRVCRELRDLTPVLLDGEPVAVDSGNAAVAMRGYKYNGITYILAVNPASQAVPVAFKVPGVAGGELQVAFDTRKLIGPGDGEFADQLEPCGVRIYMGR